MRDGAWAGILHWWACPVNPEDGGIIVSAQMFDTGAYMQAWKNNPAWVDFIAREIAKSFLTTNARYKHAKKRIRKKKGLL